MIESFNIDYKDIKIDRSGIGDLIGMNQFHLPEFFFQKLNEVISEAGRYITIRGGYILSDAVFLEKENNGLRVDEIRFDIGNIIFRQLKNTEKLAIFLCTIGKGMEEWSRQQLAGDDPVKGYIIDILASEVVEEAMDVIQNKLKMKMELEGMHITNRFSPGYCGWNVSEQHKLFLFFPENFCDIKLTDSALMTPIKSVSGIIGIGEKVIYRIYSCQQCNMKNCIYRKRRNSEE
jgi:hypothetical protein